MSYSFVTRDTRARTNRVSRAGVISAVKFCCVFFLLFCEIQMNKQDNRHPVDNNFEQEGKIQRTSIECS